MNLATDRLQANEPDIASRIMDGEAILINLQSGAYYSLRGAGALVWHLLRRHQTRDAIVHDVAGAFGESASTVQAGVNELLGTLVAEGLVRVSDRPEPVTIDEERPPVALPYQTPALEKFTDMEELLALDPPTPGALDGLMRQPLTGRRD